MEQVFRTVDTLLQNQRNKSMKHEESSKRLRLRTYRVIPLNPLAGVLEWVNDTIPLGDWLLPAHDRIRAGTGDLTVREARHTMKNEFDRPGSSPTSKLSTYVTVCNRFQPVFRFFFWETTNDPRSWLEKRAAFTASTAVASMVGHVVGLGDRHCQNILLDRVTGQVVHIDLNMIFEAGLQLRIPERVPFRLTRDIVDALGPAPPTSSLIEERRFSRAKVAIEFLRGAEETLYLLRCQHESILTILQVFKFDPLHKWTHTPLQAARRILSKVGSSSVSSTNHDESGKETKVEPTSEEEEDGKEADRALMRVKEKLVGYAPNTASAFASKDRGGKRSSEPSNRLGERGQVRLLVDQATNPELLCQMYPGWQPWV